MINLISIWQVFVATLNGKDPFCIIICMNNYYQQLLENRKLYESFNTQGCSSTKLFLYLIISFQNVSLANVLYLKNYTMV